MYAPTIKKMIIKYKIIVLWISNRLNCLNLKRFLSVLRIVPEEKEEEEVLVIEDLIRIIVIEDLVIILEDLIIIIIIEEKVDIEQVDSIKEDLIIKEGD